MEAIDPNSKATLTCRTNHCEEALEFYVAMAKAPPILGLQACENTVASPRGSNTLLVALSIPRLMLGNSLFIGSRNKRSCPTHHLTA